MNSLLRTNNLRRRLPIALAIGALAAMNGAANAGDVTLGVSVGVEPVCPYGYYDYAPYSCAPYGYYGAEWFAGGVFLGVGPWFHGPEHFRGHVDTRFDVRHGYRGELPRLGDRRDSRRQLDRIEGFRGNELREGGRRR